MEDAKFQGPHHLAQVVSRALSVSALELPEEGLLEDFFDVLYQVSFRVNAGRVVWQRPMPSRDLAAAGHLRLMPPVPFHVTSLASLLPAAQAPSALLVSSSDDQPLVIQGMLREGTGTPCPCLLQVEILGPAHLKVDAGLDYPLELRRSRIQVSTLKVFERGPVRERLSALLQSRFSAIHALLPGDVASSPLLSTGSLPLPGGNVLLSEHDWPELLEQFWIAALISLLGRVFALRSGGLVALIPRRDMPAGKEDGEKEDGEKEDGQAIESAFSHLRHLLEMRAVQAITEQVQAAQALSARLASRTDVPPDDFMLQEPPVTLKPPGSDPEVAQAIELLASLSRVDGLLRLDPALDLISFGGQIGAGRLPERVYLAGDETASEAELTPISSRSFGPRNQALLRLCQQQPNALGFAFTQDGDVRAMLWHEEKLVIWNTVLLPTR